MNNPFIGSLYIVLSVELNYYRTRVRRNDVTLKYNCRANNCTGCFLLHFYHLI